MKIYQKLKTQLKDPHNCEHKKQAKTTYQDTGIAGQRYCSDCGLILKEAQNKSEYENL